MFDLIHRKSRLLYEADKGGGEGDNIQPEESHAKDKQPVKPTKDVNPDGSMHGFPNKYSGMYNSMSDYLEEVEEPGTNGDYAFLNDINETEKERILNVLTQEDWTSDSFQGLDISEDTMEIIKKQYPDKFHVEAEGDEDKKDETETETKEEDETLTKLEEMEQEQLIEEIKKNQRLVSEKDKNYKSLEEEKKTLEAELNDLKGKKTGDDPEVNNFLEELKSDFRGTYEKYKDKFGLPDIDIVQEQLTNTDNLNARVRQYQDNQLRAFIEKKHGLESGEFEYDPSEAAKANTPSSDWDYYTGKKRQELESIQSSKVQQQQAEMDKMKERQKQDLQFVAKTYYDEDETKANNVVEEMNDVVQKILSGEEKHEKHPYAMRNLIRGFKFDELLQAEVERVKNDITKQFNDKGIYLPEQEQPTDVSKHKSSTKGKKKTVVDEKKKTYSPMLQNIEDLISS